jgi:uncharacterized protein with HEPN domain
MKRWCDFRHMLDHAREAVAMAAGKTRRDLDTDRKLNLALVRLLEVVGEAASRTPTDERTQYRIFRGRRLSGYGIG